MIHKTFIPNKREVKLSFTVPEHYVGAEVELIAFIKSEEQDASIAASPALEGKPLSNQQFLKWVEDAESLPTVSLEDAKSQWAKKREELTRTIK